MSNFLAFTASATQKNLISINPEHWCLTVLFAMPTAVELLQFTGVGGCGWPISSRVSQNIVACLQYENNAPTSSSAADAMTNRNIAHKVQNAPLNLICCVGLGFHPMKKCPHALLCAFASDKYDASEWMLISYPTHEFVLLRPSEWPNNQGLFCFLHPVLGAMCLLAHYCAESHHHCQVEWFPHNTRCFLWPVGYVFGVREGGGSI